LAKKTASTDDDVTVIKKYANRRLYNTATSSYVTLEHLCEMVKQGREFTVHDAKTGEDITRSVLAQIIFEEEGKSGQNLLPINFLRQLIGFYGDSLQSFVPSYLEMSMETFSKEQEKLRDRMASAFGGRERMGLGNFEEQMRQNFAMFDSALKMFSPFTGRTRSNEKDGEQATDADSTDPKADSAERDKELDALKKQIATMQSQLDALAKK